MIYNVISSKNKLRLNTTLYLNHFDLGPFEKKAVVFRQEEKKGD